jgi:predicted nuclease of predicted toxin-antitoxin system
MLLLVADENFNNDILRGLLRRDPSLDIVRIQDVGLTKAPDPIVLEWAAHENRVLLTHDRNTITKFAYERVVSGKPMPGVIEDILLVATTSDSGDWEGQIIYLPLR